MLPLFVALRTNLISLSAHPSRVIESCQMSDIHFFALTNDIFPLLQALEAQMLITYTTVKFDALPKQQWLTAEDLPDLGLSNSSQSVAATKYLITERHTLIKERPVRQNSGELWYAIDQVLNPESVTLIPGGIWKNRIIIGGRFARTSSAAVPRGLMELARKYMKQYFIQHDQVWIGPEALSCLRNGYRLTFSEGSPSEYDIHLKPEE